MELQGVRVQNNRHYFQYCIMIFVFLFIATWLNIAHAIDIIGFGDSIAQGWPYVTRPVNGRRTGGYEPKLERLFADAGHSARVLNYGIAGETTTQGVRRIDNVLRRTNAEYILIFEGTNDANFGVSPQTIISNLRFMIDRARAYGVEPILATLTPDERLSFKNISTVLNPAIRELAIEKKVMLCDQYDAVVGWNWSVDGLHPNNTGYQLIAQAWFDILRLFFDPIIALQAYNGQYIAAEGGGGGFVFADRDTVGDWESFELITLGGNQIALQASDGHYVVAESGGGGFVYADRDFIDFWETWELITVGNNLIALRTINGQYLVADGGGGGFVFTDRDEIGDWETFDLVTLANDNAVLQAETGIIPNNSVEVRAFVTRFYEQSLSREPDTTGLNDWTDSLLKGSNTGTDVAYGFIFSNEFLTKNAMDEEFLEVLYQAFFDRLPDHGGWKNWLALLNGSPDLDRGTREYVLDGFLYSQEFSELCDRFGINPH